MHRQVDLRRQNIRASQPVTVQILNYRKSGQSFLNQIHVSPLRDSTGKTVLFVGVQMDVTARRAGLAPPSVVVVPP